MSKCVAYQLIKERNIPELNSMGKLLRHKKTGARVFLLENEDENKAFAISFRTPPSDDTGLPHILEHSVLCGSKNFPSKDPFVELAKGSLNTFLNAMTFPDKTVYPIASCNDKDYRNLMHVYLDAVFYPNIYNNEMIFKQEGWHYELEDADAPLTINGVVYNEMKGAFSSPDGVVERYSKSLLFPDNAYANESGGDPVAIPELTYEDFLAFHKKYYHPSNSYIYLYGNLDMEDTLRFIDEEYLSHFEAVEIESEIGWQEPFEKMLEERKEYNIAQEEEETRKTYLCYAKATGDALNRKEYLAFQVLEYALLTAPGAPLKEALTEAGIGDDVDGGFENALRQGMFTVTARGTEEDRKEEFLQIIEETLRKVVSEGFSKKSLQAGLSGNEFRFREADFGRFPKGLVYGLQAMDSWLHDDEKPEIHLVCEDTFKELYEAIETDYYEQLVQKYLLDNQHGVVLVLAPKKGLTAEQDAELAEKLRQYKESLTTEEVEKLAEETKALKEYQSEPSREEDVDKIPMLAVSDIRKEVAHFVNREAEQDGCKFLLHDVPTNGIGYVNLHFQANGVAAEDYPWLSLLKSVVSYVDTENFSYQDLSDEVNIYTGGMEFGLTSYSNDEDPDDCKLMFELQTSFLKANAKEMFRLAEEMILHTDFSDEKRIKVLIARMKVQMESYILESGHSAAVQRACSYFSKTSWMGEKLGGIAFYQFLEQLEKNWEEKKVFAMEKLHALLTQICTASHLLVDITAEESMMEDLMGQAAEFAKKLPEGRAETYVPLQPDYNKENEGFATASQVNYVARCGNFKDGGFSYHGSMKVLQTIMRYDYLWTNLRVKGGAYGCMSGFGRNGESYFVSYRDPNVTKTDEVYEEVPAYLEQFSCKEKDMERYIIGTISGMDTPLTPRLVGRRSASAYLTGLSVERLQKERNQVLSATAEDIRALADPCKAVLSGHYLCTVGNADKLQSEKELFDVIKNLSV